MTDGTKLFLSFNDELMIIFTVDGMSITLSTPYDLTTLSLEYKWGN